MVGATLCRLDPATVAGRSPTRPCASGGRAPPRELLRGAGQSQGARGGLAPPCPSDVSPTVR